MALLPLFLQQAPSVARVQTCAPVRMRDLWGWGDLLRVRRRLQYWSDIGGQPDRGGGILGSGVERGVGRSYHRAGIAELRRVEAVRPTPRGQAAPGVVDQGDDPGEQALPPEASLGKVAD